MRARGRAPLATVALAAVALAVLVVGCSIDTDAEPRPLSVSTSTTTPATTPTSGGASADLYFVNDSKLVPVSMSMPDHELDTVLTSLLDTTDPTSSVAGISSAIPVGTKLTNLRLENGRLSLDLSDEFDNVVGPSRQLAIAQIVLTATELPDVDDVRFSVDGHGIQVATPDRGDAGTVTACDYRSLLATADDLRDAGASSATIARAGDRATELSQSCRTTR